MTVFAQRAAFTDERLAEASEALRAKLASARGQSALREVCIYATGSGGRGEMNPGSDLDVFLVRVGDVPVGKALEEHRLDQMVLQGAVVEAFDDLGLERPSNGGEFLELHTSEALCQQIGDRSDDPENSFTARMLLLLESRPLVGAPAYDRLLNRVLTTYWENWPKFEGNKPETYVPFLLINDVVRFWRILLLSYVAKNLRGALKKDSVAEKDRRSYKLRFARCLTCYSMLLELLALERSGVAMSPAQIREVVARRPLERLRQVAAVDPESQAAVDELVAMYNAFLEVDGGARVKERFQDKAFGSARIKDGMSFGDKVYGLMLKIAKQDSKVLRSIVV